MLFIKLPEILPSSNGSNTQERSPISKGKKIAGSLPRASAITTGSTTKHPLKEKCQLDKFPEGYVSKMLVYKNGEIKLKLGDVMFGVRNLSPC